MDNYWKFEKIKRIEEYTFNQSLEKFFKSKIDGIVRENIQNALDAKLPKLDEPVKVTINVEEVLVNQFPGIEELIKRVPHLVGKNEYSKDTINNMKRAINKNKVKVLSFEDENTKGLKFANDNNDTWKAYAFKKGVHNIDSDEEAESLRGGSHGIGKIASNAASELFVVYFSNCDEAGNKLVGGTVQLLEHEFKNEYYRSTGYFAESSEKEIPFENKWGGVFKKSTRGLKILIPFYKDDFGNEKDIIKSVCDNFFLAILHEKLVVSVGNKEINKKNITKYVEDEELYPQNLGVRSTELTPLYLKTYNSQIENKIEFKVKDKNNTSYEFDLFFRYDESITKGRAGIIRSIGMKIEDYKVIGAATKPFNAILIPSNSECDKFLKSLENESHTELSYKHFKVKKYEDNAKKFLSNLTKELKIIIDNYIKENTETDGEIETGEIVHTVENSFTKILGEKDEIIKIGDDAITKRKPEKRNGGKKEKSNNVKPNIEPRGTRIPKKTNNNGERDKDEIYSVTTHSVKRAIISKKEILELDLGSNKHLKNGKEVNLFFKVVDGMGKEYDNELVLEEMYGKIFDENTGSQLDVKDNKIINLVIGGDKVKISFELKDEFNKSLKYKYYLEA